MAQEGRTTFVQRLVSPILLWVIVALGVVIIFHLTPGRALFHRNTISVVVFALIVVNWVYFFVGTALVHREVARSAADITHLVTTGVYSKVRHPAYSADILLMWGVFLLFPTLQFLVGVIWFTVMVTVWMKLEESALIAKFGDEYLRYKATMPMVIPRYLGR
jgi:protein-S-isoprenylcysteine O-methyltransferase Ste14